MKASGLLVCASLLLTAGSFAEEPQPTDAGSDRLTIRVVGLRSSRGSVAVALFDSQTSYESRTEPVRKVFLPIEDQTCEWVVEGLAPGEYAAMLFHDKNDNGKLDKRPLGIPKEPYGFSNNARATFGPPSFDQAKFVVDGPRTIEIRLR